MSELVREGGSYRHPRDPGEPTTGTRRLSVTDEEGAILRALAARKRVIEVGTGLGVSARYMAETAKYVLTVDVDEWAREQFNHDCPVGAMCVDAIPDASEEFDLAFIDGSHLREHVTRDIKAVLPLLRKPGGILVLHDIKYKHVEAGALDAGITYRMLKTEHGLGLVFL